MRLRSAPSPTGPNSPTAGPHTGFHCLASSRILPGPVWGFCPSSVKTGLKSGPVIRTCLDQTGAKISPDAKREAWRCVPCVPPALFSCPSRPAWRLERLVSPVQVVCSAWSSVEAVPPNRSDLSVPSEPSFQSALPSTPSSQFVRLLRPARPVHYRAWFMMAMIIFSFPDSTTVVCNDFSYARRKFFTKPLHVVAVVDEGGLLFESRRVEFPRAHASARASAHASAHARASARARKRTRTQARTHAATTLRRSASALQRACGCAAAISPRRRSAKKKTVRFPVPRH